MSSEIAIQNLSRERIELIKQTVAKGATDLELELFLHACQRTGLDPLMKQIYAIKRWSSQDKREMLTFQTGIDGYRLIADRTGQYAGSDEPVYEMNPQREVEKATVTVTKLVNGLPCKFSASALWAEYVQRKQDGTPTSMWQKMPFLMLAKCAEALALRKAFPAELSGIYTHEEMMQADKATPLRDNKNAAQAKIQELRTETPREPDGLDAPPTPETASQPSQDEALVNDPAETWRAKLRTCEQSVNGINAAYYAIPETIRQDCHGQYTAQLKQLGKKKYKQEDLCKHDKAMS